MSFSLFVNAMAASRNSFQLDGAFAIPVLVFAYLVRKHLIAGVTLGAVRR